jgi:hypothetical protein
MDFIQKKARDFVDIYFMGSVSPHKEVIDAIRSELNDLRGDGDKIKYLNSILARNNKDYAAHKLKCTNPENCPDNYSYENIAYFITNELSDFGVRIDNDTFSREEKDNADLNLDKILNDLRDLKLGQQVIYEDLTKELNDLRELYYLGKKRWFQLFLGKSIDMAASGVVSETISKQIIEEVRKVIPKLIGN